MNPAVISEIYIYGKYPESGQSLSVFMGQREDMGQSPGNLGRGFGAWWSQGVRVVGIRLQRSDRRLRVASTAPTLRDIILHY